MMCGIMISMLFVVHMFDSNLICHGSVDGPSISTVPIHRHRHHPHVLAPDSHVKRGCDQDCLDPLTSSPLGSPCGCVFPMKVTLLLDVAPLSVFPMVNELEIEIATCIYLKQSQVIIVGANVDAADQDKTLVDINLVPLGEKFDNTTAMLMYERFFQKNVQLNTTLFGNYEVISINYQGLPSSPLFGTNTGLGPTDGPKNLPVSAKFPNTNRRVNFRMVALIAVSSCVLLLVCVGTVAGLIKCRQVPMPSSSVNSVFAHAMNKRLGNGSTLSSIMTSSTTMSFVSAITSCMFSVKTYSLAEVEKATGRFSSKKVLGEGGFGRVYHGLFEDGSEAAVKLLTRDDHNRDPEFIEEVEMQSRLHHRNLVKLFGICIEGRTRCLVYELVRNGSLESHLHGAHKRNKTLDWPARMKIALGAARGLAYLHEDSNPRVIHRDFKAANILLEDDFTPKISDFGLAREATEGSRHISTRVMGTFGYVAPEYAMTGHLLVKSDVYSYGVMLLELLSGRKPVDMSQHPGHENLVTWSRPLLTTRDSLRSFIDPSLSENYPFDDVAKVAAIASMCVQIEVTNRPFMGEVVQALKLICNDNDETCGDFCSGGSSASGSDAICNGIYGSENGRFSTWSFVDERVYLPISHGNRSGPLRTVRSEPGFNRGSVSEHGGLVNLHFWPWA